LAAFDINSDIIPLLRVSETRGGELEWETGQERKEKEKEGKEKGGTYYVAESCD
jgi:hypothetical protein